MLIPLGFLAAAGGAGATFEHIQTALVTSNVASVTFNNLAQYASSYKHLHLRMTLRDNTNSTANGTLVRLNGDSTANYAYHGIAAGGSSVSSFNATNTTFGLASNIPSAQAPSGIFAVALIDLIDAFNTNKFKTARVLCSHNNSSPNVEVRGWHWRNTAAINSIEVGQSGNSLVPGCRVSLYGVK
jgi:hypothetical protein